MQVPRLVTDVSFDCPIKFYVNSLEKVNGQKTRIYRYVLNGPRAKVFSEAMGDGPATHSDDVMFFLGIALNKVSSGWQCRVIRVSTLDSKFLQQGDTCRAC